MQGDLIWHVMHQLIIYDEISAGMCTQGDLRQSRRFHKQHFLDPVMDFFRYHKAEWRPRGNTESADSYVTIEYFYVQQKAVIFMTRHATNVLWWLASILDDATIHRLRWLCGLDTEYALKYQHSAVPRVRGVKVHQAGNYMLFRRKTIFCILDREMLFWTNWVMKTLNNFRMINFEIGYLYLLSYSTKEQHRAFLKLFGRAYFAAHDFSMSRNAGFRKTHGKYFL